MPWKDILMCFAYASPLYPFLTLWAHRDMMASIEPEEEQKLHELRAVLDENAENLPKATFWASGAGCLCLGGLLFISTFFVQWIWGEENSLRWNYWFALVNGCAILTCGTVYSMGYQDILLTQRLEVEWVEKWRKERRAEEENGTMEDEKEKEKEAEKLTDV